MEAVFVAWHLHGILMLPYKIFQKVCASLGALCAVRVRGSDSRHG